MQGQGEKLGLGRTEKVLNSVSKAYRVERIDRVGAAG